MLTNMSIKLAIKQKSARKCRLRWRMIRVWRFRAFANSNWNLLFCNCSIFFLKFESWHSLYKPDTVDNLTLYSFFRKQKKNANFCNKSKTALFLCCGDLLLFLSYETFKFILVKWGIFVKNGPNFRKRKKLQKYMNKYKGSFKAWFLFNKIGNSCFFHVGTTYSYVVTIWTRDKITIAMKYRRKCQNNE